MSGAAAVVAVVLSVFFLVGVAVGIVTVIAVSSRRAGKRADKAVRPDRAPVASRRTWPYLDEASPDDDEPGEPSSWPTRGGAESGPVGWS